MTIPTGSTRPAAQPPLDAETAPAGHRSPASRRRGRFWVAVLAALAAVVGGGLVTANAWTRESAPNTAAVAYFHALGRGDAAAALALGEVPSGVHTYLTSEVLAASRKIATMSDVHLLSVERTGHTAKVTLQYQLNYAGGPTTVTDSVATVRRGRSWRLTKTAVPVDIQVEAASARMSIAGAPVPSRTVLFFPGALPISLDTPNLELANQVVHLNGAVPHTITPRVSRPGKQAVGAAVAAAVSGCIGGRASGPCPPPDDQRVVPGSVRGTVTGDVADQMRVSVESDASGRLRVIGTVDVKGSYQRLDFDNLPVHKTGPVELSIYALCDATDPSKIVWEPTS